MADNRCLKTPIPSRRYRENTKDEHQARIVEVAAEQGTSKWPWLRYPTVWAAVALETAARSFCSAFVAANPSTT
ncbi:MAG: hypothetical protein OJF58_004701 [Enhydrobacter sp.]|jgi:hypothetical protein|nr:MAG: hypothetical protein OJF58_004701 [Enhydrobacter sp.]